jgi:hypothetical protein
MGKPGIWKILEPEPKDGEQKRDDKLPEELLARFEVFEVVHKAEDARRQGREEDKGEFLEGNAVTRGSKPRMTRLMSTARVMAT